MMMSSGEEETEIFSMHDKSLSNAPGGNVIKSLGKRRSRQRVDAGEPRNSYASIPNFSSRPPQSSLTSVANTSNNTGHLFNGFGGAAKMLNDLNGRALIGAAEPEMAVVEGARKMNGDNEGNVYALHDSFNHRLDKAHLLRDMLQASATNKGSSQLSKFLNSAGRPSRTPSPNEEVSSDRGNSPIDGRCVIVSCEEEVMRRRAGGMEDAKNIGVAKCDQMAPSSTDPTNNDDGTSLLVKSPVHSQLIVDELVSKSDSCSGRNYSALPSRCSIIESTRPDNRQNIFDSRDVHSRPRNMGDDVASSDDASGQHLTASSTPLERHSTTTTMMNGGSSPTHALPTPSPEPSSSPIESLSDNHLIDRSSPIRSSDSPVQQKRARVENIVTSMLVSNTSQGGHQQVNGCKKRKQYQPQQHESVNARSSNCESEEEDEYEQEWPRMKHRKVEKESLEGQLKWMQEQLTVMQEKYNSLLTTSCGNDENGSEADNRGSSSINANDAEDSESSNEKPTPDVTEDEEDDDAKDSEDTDKGKEKQSLANKTHYNHSMHSSEGLIDPSLFIDEARRLVSEQQERIAKENETIVTGTSEPQPQAQNLQCKERNASANANRHTPNNVNNTHIQQTANAAALLSNVVEFIKLELSSSLPRIVDMIVANYIAHQPRSVVLQAQKMISETSPMANKDYYSNVDRKSPRTKVSDRGRIANGMQTPTSGSGASMNSMSKDASSPMCRPYGERSPHIKSSSGAVFPTIAKMPTAPLNIMFGGGLPTSSHPSPNLPPFSQGTTNNSSSSQTQSSLIPESSPEQTEAMSLVIPAKKKRTKVTDTRPSSRSIRGFGQEADSPNSGAGKYMFPFSSGTESSPSNFHPASLTPIVPSTLPTSVAIPNPSLHQSDIFSAASGYPFEHSRLSVGNLESSRLYREDSEISRTPSSHHLTLQQHLLMTSHNTPSDIQSIRSFQSHHAKGDLNSRDSENGNDHHLNSSHLGSSDGISSPYDNGVVALSSTLTPMHLRKAKLMFFYVRYPSSAVLKTFFPDIKFNKNNTAQLVKWFSNFREFYYIQMEKYARQAISEGIKNSDDISVSTDSEIYRILNLHYNRNNHIEVPPNFRYIVEQSLREFFKAVHAGKDTEQSWKKAIYKVIARLDDNVPEYFKSPNFLEQLE